MRMLTELIEHNVPPGVEVERWPMIKILYWPVVIALLIYSANAGAQQDWQIHEWGTFTSLQDEFGRAIGGINTDDEPVPDFVHSYFPICRQRTSFHANLIRACRAAIPMSRCGRKLR